MAPYVTCTWSPPVTDGVPRRFRRSGQFQAYVPLPLAGRAVTLRPDTRAVAAEAGELARAVAVSLTSVGLGLIGDLLVRSEAAASSLIEGYGPSAKAVALADFARRGRPTALVVARNLNAVRASLARSTVAGISLVDETLTLHAAITPGSAGVRRQPVWIGGASPLEAHFNAPPADTVPDLLRDLDGYLATHAHSPVVAAALAHAQFETIHPFTDGNGRAGRVLLGMVLSREGLTPGVTLPVSTELFRDRLRYYAALDAYRRGDDDAVVVVVAEAVAAAAEQSKRLSEDVATLQEQQAQMLHTFLAAKSPTGRVRRGTAHRLLEELPRTPVLDAASVSAGHHVSDNAARAALEMLAEAGLLHRDRKTDRTRTLYVATALLDLIAVTLPAPRDDAATDQSLGETGLP